MSQNIIRPDFKNFVREEAAFYKTLQRLDQLITHCQQAIDYADQSDLEKDLKSNQAKKELRQGYNHALQALKSLIKAIDEEIKFYKIKEKS